MKKATITVGRFNITFEHEERQAINRFAVNLHRNEPEFSLSHPWQFEEVRILRVPPGQDHGPLTADEVDGIKAAIIDHMEHWHLNPTICPQHGGILRCPGCVGSIKSKAKAKASAKNGLLGGRPHHLRGGRPRKQPQS